MNAIIKWQNANGKSVATFTIFQRLTWGKFLLFFPLTFGPFCGQVRFYFFSSIILENFFLLLEYMNISFTFVWSFTDIFIIIVSIAIASKFRKINERLEFFRGRVIISIESCLKKTFLKYNFHLCYNAKLKAFSFLRKLIRTYKNLSENF